MKPFSNACLQLACAAIAWQITNYTQADPVQWEIAEGGNGHFYEVVLSGPISWPEADSEAKDRGGYLATLTSLAENEFVFSLVDNDEFWMPFPQYNINLGPLIGGFQPPGSPEPDGNWQWVTGEPFTFTNWHSGEPSNFGLEGAEDALQFYNSPFDHRAGTWNDTTGDASSLALAYVVEYPVPETSSLVLALMGLASCRHLSRCRSRRRHSQLE